MSTCVNNVKNCDNGEITLNSFTRILRNFEFPNLSLHEFRLKINSVVMLINRRSVNEVLYNME